MKELIFQDQIVSSRKKRSLIFSEIFHQDGYCYTAQIKNIFRLKDSSSFTTQEEASSWVNRHTDDCSKARRLSLMKVWNRKKQKSIWSSKASGILYLLHNDNVLTFSYLQLLRVSVTGNIIDN